jgi:hypothetical protein
VTALDPLRSLGRLARDEHLRRRSLHALRHRFGGARGTVFNLDLHVAVIADVAAQIERRNGSVTSWTVSGHSWTLGRDLDPVAVVNDRTWKELDHEMAGRFRRAYGSYLRRFRGFVAAYPPAFALLCEGLDRPTLAVAATRYEWPFTHDAARWEWLDERLRKASRPAGSPSPRTTSPTPTTSSRSSGSGPSCSPARAGTPPASTPARRLSRSCARRTTTSRVWRAPS